VTDSADNRPKKDRPSLPLGDEWDEEPLLDEDGAWSPGEPVVTRAPHVGRNDPCLCGSGKKFKKCCGRPKGAR
jgi:uncharacterized protein YecA (UPF0149 family)